jgi:hypothetical protein
VESLGRQDSKEGGAGDNEREAKGGRYGCIYTLADQEAAISESTGAEVNVDALLDA